ncbi:hypothetical protein DET65_1270 [Sunxiuqinia elliptica]|uniref:Uncharacterized protein n=1 Tax=Sunxiuqinia elliptica TaxID=655355 RepID=A0A4R6HA18_9BACT|nr:hypothetical protein DET52_101711 [Sunxiuqinia elliptica]TDO64902.1 hypothetical protein DET65_1270 [Sunxiuqinia elliptica]
MLKKGDATNTSFSVSYVPELLKICAHNNLNYKTQILTNL